MCFPSKLHLIFSTIFLTAALSSELNPQKVPQRRLKILVYSPTVGWSHMQFLGKMADTLAEAGHEVHFMRVMLNKRLEALPKEVHKATKVYDFLPTFIGSGQMDVAKMDNLDNPFSGKHFKTFLFQSDLMNEFNKIYSAICQGIVNDSALITRLASEQFDVAISEFFDLCPFAVFHRIGAKTKLAASAVPLYGMAARRFGIPTFSSYVFNMHTAIEQVPFMNFWERFVNFFNDFYEWIHVTDASVHAEEPFIRNAFGDDFPGLKEISRNVSLIFTNSNQFFELARPISNKVINVGGLVGMNSEKLDPSLNSLLDRSRAGTVLVSFGTFADTRAMRTAMKLAFLRAFARFPDYEFIWKIELAEPNDTAIFAEFKNVHPMKWLNQKAVLGHPKLRAFITHCGMNSISEAARAGVPLLAIPLFGDQLFNAILVRVKGMAIQLDVARLNSEGADQLIWVGLDKVLRDPSYRAAAQLIKRKFELTPFSPREKLIRWVEFAAEFGQLSELNLPWEEELGLLAYYSIDAIIFTITVLAIAIWILYIVVKLLMKYMIRDQFNKMTNGGFKTKNMKLE